MGQKGFKINESTGVITTALDDSYHLDYESMSVIILQVIAIDLANHTTYATLTINLIDVNDVPPKLYLVNFNRYKTLKLIHIIRL